ncbi:MAG: hypothetical protein JXR25_04105 [Pontiellaceae bacterium]|nr:hypothetical protein [Pontiellaceae bacterium]MBN2783986.1 hypothetical protein [Pontiellaceae bacterium]
MDWFDCGFLGIPFRLYEAVNGVVSGIIGAVGSLLFWSMLCSAVVLFLYRVCSPQETLKMIKVRMRELQAAMAKEQDDLSEVLRLSRENIAIAFKRFLLTFLPTCVAVIPLLSLATWLHSEYAFQPPTPEQRIAVSSIPDGANLLLQPEGVTGLRISMPDGSQLATLSLPPKGSVLAKKTWWNHLLGNPVGYLPADAGPDAVKIGFSHREFIRVGPGWLRGWETIFIGGMTLFSLVLKLAFKVE